MSRMLLLAPIAILVMLFALGLREGRSAMVFWSANRADNPVGFWLGQAFIGLIVALLLAVMATGAIQ